MVADENEMMKTTMVGAIKNRPTATMNAYFRSVRAISSATLVKAERTSDAHEARSHPNDPQCQGQQRCGGSGAR